MSAQLRRRHLADGAYFIWRCQHKNGQPDRVSDKNDGEQQEDCEVELVDPPDYAHFRRYAEIDLAEAMSEFYAAVDKVSERLLSIQRDLLRKP